MGEADELFDLGRMKGGIGLVGRGQSSGRHVNLPEAVGGVAAMASENGLVIMHHSHVVLGEGGSAVGITELANGKQRRVEAVKDVGLGGGGGETGDGKVANGMGADRGAIGHGNRNGKRVSSDIGETRCGGGKEMAGGAGVSNNRHSD